jgi:hypothetical protein
MLSVSTGATDVHTAIFDPVWIPILQIANLGVTTDGVGGMQYESGSERGEF